MQDFSPTQVDRIRKNAQQSAEYRDLLMLLWKVVYVDRGDILVVDGVRQAHINHVRDALFAARFIASERGEE